MSNTIPGEKTAGSDLSVKDAAALLNVSKTTIWQMISLGKLQTYQVRRVRRIRHESIEAVRRGGAE